MTSIDPTQPGMACERPRPTVWGLLVATCVLAMPVPAGASALISEVFYDASGSDDGQLFVEIWGPAGLALEPFVLEGVNGSNGAVGPVVALSGSIPDDGLFLVADARSDATSDVVGADLLASFDFQNGPDSIVLREGDAVVDAIGYGLFEADEVFAGEGTPASDAPPGASLARRFANRDTDDNAFDFVVLDVPTPGLAPLAVPEAGSTALWLIGGAQALRAGRRRAAARAARG